MGNKIKQSHQGCILQGGDSWSKTEWQEGSYFMNIQKNGVPCRVKQSKGPMVGMSLVYSKDFKKKSDWKEKEGRLVLDETVWYV